MLASALVCVVSLLAAPVASAEFPFGDSQQRSLMGANGDPAFSAANADVAYESTRDRYMIVWQGTDSAAEGPEIWGRVVSRLHTNLSIDFKISDTPGTLTSETPTISYNPKTDQFLVLWAARQSDTSAKEIYGQLLTHLGDEVGSDFSVSSTGSGLAAFDASAPDLAYNPATNRYLAVWRSDDQQVGEYEIYGQALLADTSPVGPDDFRVSTMGPEGSLIFGGYDPAVAADSVNHRFLVAWSGDNTVDDEREIYTRAFDANASPLAAQRRISHMGPDGAKAFGAFEPSLAFDPATRQYLLVWRGDTTGQDEQFEVYAQRLDASNNEVGAPDARVSDMGPDGSTAYAVAGRPAVEYVSVTQRYLVVWHGDDNTPPLVDGEMEIFGQALSAVGEPLGVNDFRVSTFGPAGNPNTDATSPELAYSPLANQSLVVWQGNGAGSLAPAETEIFSQRVGVDTDRDGKIDGLDDACRTVPGGSFDANHDGCPDDSDGDRLIDAVDRCPRVAGGAYDADHNGCPDDTDRDGVLDVADQCRTKAGGRLDRNHDGCPGPFRSLDGRVHLDRIVVEGVRYIHLDLLNVTGLPRTRATVTIRCVHICRIAERLPKHAGRSTVVRSRRFLHRRLRVGSVITVRITATDLIGVVLRFKVSRTALREIVKSRRCIPIGSTRTRKTCPPGQ